MGLSIIIPSSQQQPADVAGRKAGREDSGEKSRPSLSCMCAWMIAPTRNLQFNKHFMQAMPASHAAADRNLQVSTVCVFVHLCLCVWDSNRKRKRKKRQCHVTVVYLLVYYEKILCFTTHLSTASLGYLYSKYPCRQTVIP